ncbi:AAA domain-containing protein, partial [candidate division GN15 bacterium]|nr:AAA domain-containing protein [candidate division GN15 bacterium]
ELQDRLSGVGYEGQFITRNKAMLTLLTRLQNIARTGTSVLLLGESGTGKEVLANMIHRCSQRADQPMVKLNCAAIAQSQIEAELFGIGKRVATDVDEREGKFGAANGGTLFLDEIGDMPLDVQAKVLGVLETRVYEKVGTTRPIQADIRFVYATNKDLDHMVARGDFRLDLYHRINTIAVHITPLRERPEDIPLLLDFFLKRFSHADKTPRVSKTALDILMRYDWPGNVRELRNFVDNHCVLRGTRDIVPEDLPEELTRRAGQGTERTGIRPSYDDLTRERLAQGLARNEWNRSATAREMNIPISTLRRWIKKYGLRPPATP